MGTPVHSGRSGIRTEITPFMEAFEVKWSLAIEPPFDANGIAAWASRPAFDHKERITRRDRLRALGVDRAMLVGWPATLSATFAVAACYEYDTLYREMIEDSCKYILQGLKVPASVIHFPDADDRISGSSLATAVATGLSSLILSCLRPANPEQQFSGLRWVKLEEKLNEMPSHSNSKYVILEKLQGLITA
ncbi:putative reverse transcriptase [Purpureocillium lavendulum]|uniref:Reverse transcriptase n=1 Tax=Purpureocillium lavendulum TaxID=1247861 RepID=A0AB34FBE2_9HYPO|nr:putative reverse transcriptase [Purpureocillium lavendulum]